MFCKEKCWSKLGQSSLSHDCCEVKKFSFITLFVHKKHIVALRIEHKEAMYKIMRVSASMTTIRYLNLLDNSLLVALARSHSQGMGFVLVVTGVVMNVVFWKDIYKAGMAKLFVETVGYSAGSMYAVSFV